MVVALAVAELRMGRGTEKAIADRYGVTDRTIRNWRARVDAAPDADPQLAQQVESEVDPQGLLDENDRKLLAVEQARSRGGEDRMVATTCPS